MTTTTTGDTHNGAASTGISKVTVNLPADLVAFVKARADARSVPFTQELRDILSAHRYITEQVLEREGKLLAALPGSDVREIVFTHAV